MENKNYNHTKEFKNECLPHIVKIKQFCLKNNIPFYMTFCTSNQDKEEYITSKQLPPECGVELNDDKFRLIILAERGFDIAINQEDTFDMDDICDNVLKPPKDIVAKKK